MLQRSARLVVALLCVLAVSAVMPVAAPEESIESAKQDREEARREQLEAQLELELIEAEDLEVVEALQAASELVDLEKAKVAAAQQRLDAAVEAASQAESEVEEAVAAIELLREGAVAYAVESYVGLSDSYAEAWMEADDATTAAHKVALLETLSSETNDVLDRLKAIEDRRRDLAEEAARLRAEADSVRAELDVALGELEDKLAVQVAIKDELEARRAAWEEALAQAEAEEQRLTEFIKAEEERIEREREEKRRAALAAAARAAGRGTVNVGAVSADGWVWPTAGGIASRFGQRLHPILGYYRMHTGVDLGGRTGQPIWAAQEGIVIKARYDGGGYGNVVVIQHENGVSTIYAHMSGFNTSVGEYVFAGDVIGYVGSTGLSTGPHLHFEIRFHGAPIDPLPYMP